MSQGLFCIYTEPRLAFMANRNYLKLSFGNKDELWQIIDLLPYVQIQPNCVLM